MNYSQIERLTLTSANRSSRRPASSAPMESSSSNESLRTEEYREIDDRELARALKRIEKLSAEIRAHDNAAGYARELHDRIAASRKKAAHTIFTLNARMDEIEQAWDDQIIAEQKSIAKEVLSILKSLKEGELSAALNFKKGRSSRSGSRSSSRAGSLRSSSNSSVNSSSMSKNIAHLEERGRQFEAKSTEVKKDAKRLQGMSRNLDSVKELERAVCDKLGRLHAAGEGTRPPTRGSVYGTVELVENYRLSVEHLAAAIRSLSAVSCLPAITNDDPITKSEIDKMCEAMAEFLVRIKAQMSNQPSAETLPQSRVRVAGKKNSSVSSSSCSGTYNTSHTAIPSAPSSYASQSEDPSIGASTAMSIASGQSASTAHSIESQQQ